MEYLLVKKEVLVQRGIYLDSQELSDGRVVLSINALKVIGRNAEGVEIITQDDLENILQAETEKKKAEEPASLFSLQSEL